MDYAALACFAWTCFAYFMAKKIYRKKPLMIFSPVVTVSVSTIVLMLLLGISYDTYHKYTQGIVFLAHAGNGRLRHPDLRKPRSHPPPASHPVDSDFGRHVRRRGQRVFDG